MHTKTTKGGLPMTLRKDTLETKRRILSVCVRLFLQQGYHATSISQIAAEAGISVSTFQNIFHTKDAVLHELIGFMFSGQFSAARDMTGPSLPPLYVYAAETAIQLALTELNENLRDIYLVAYSLPETAEYIHRQTAAELLAIFGPNFPGSGPQDFYELEIGTAGLMRGYMAQRCGLYFPLERKIQRFLTSSMRVYRVPEEAQSQALAYIAGLNVTATAGDVMAKLFSLLEMTFDFKLTETEETT